MKKIKFIGLAAAILVIALVMSSCGSSGNSGSSGSSATGAKVEIDSAKAVEKTIPAAEGGQLSLDMTEGGKMKIIFPQEALAQDSSLVMAPVSSTPFDGKDLLVKGFSLEVKGTGQGPVLKSPALLVFSFKSAVPAEVSVIKYREDGSGYDVIPSKVLAKDGKSLVTASVSSFSEYGIKLLSSQEKGQSGQEMGQSGQDKSQSGQETKDFNWVIYVKDKYSFTTGPMKQSITVDLKAVNTSGDIAGMYNGTVSALTTNDGSFGRGTMTGPMNSKDPNLSFTVGVPALAPLTDGKSAPATQSEDDGKLAPLEPSGDDDKLAPLTDDSQEPDLSAYGNINMKTAGTVTGRIGAWGGSKGIKDSSSVPFEMNIFGPQVRMVVNMPQGTMYFDGYIRGEGK